MARGNTAWINGKLVPAEDHRVSLFAHGLHYGTGVFEGIRAYKQEKGGGGVFRLKEHVQRLRESCLILDIPLEYSDDQIIKACVDTCRSNQFEECYIRPLAFIDDGPLGIDIGDEPPVTLAVLVWEWGKYLGKDGVRKGVHVKTSSFIRPHPNSIMTKGKITGQYVTSVLAKREAKKNGFDEAVFLDPNGFLSEGSGQNLFIVKKGIIKTTPPTSILNGITRQTIIDHLRSRNYQVIEQQFSRDEFWAADEAFFTGTAAEITPIRMVDHRPIKGNIEGPGPVTAQLQKDYVQMVRGSLAGLNPEWITPI